jgi:16S rRNA (guanine(966)-N(2))-methyltransferase RsmD
LRISSGQLKGRRIASRKAFSFKHANDELRPTSAKVREALFNILQNEISDAVFLDLYAGTGAVGLEALSRGAGQVIFVETSQVRVKAMKDFVREIHAGERAAVYREKAEYFLNRASSSGAQVDIIFADPPYRSEEYRKLFRMLAELEVLKEGGFFILEHASKMELPLQVDPLRLVKQYTYGDTKLSLYRKTR